MLYGLFGGGVGGGGGVFFFQAEDGIRDLVRSRGLGDVYKRQILDHVLEVRDVLDFRFFQVCNGHFAGPCGLAAQARCIGCLLYTSDAADERSSVDLGGRRIIKKNTTKRLQVTIGI